jgi:hypothetical protein
MSKLKLKSALWLISRILYLSEYRRYAERYPHKIIFIAGLPKSGTTWLANMFASVPGYRLGSPSHVRLKDHNLRQDTFREFDRRLVIVRMHTPPSQENISTLKQEGIRYCVLYRDLRDVAISWFYYVKNEQEHFLHNTVKDMSLNEGIEFFAENRLGGYASWIRGWRENRDRLNSIEITYEALLQDTRTVFAELARFFSIKLSDRLLDKIVRVHSFRSQAGRDRGEEDITSFLRKGIEGDWKNHFSETHKQRFKEIAGDLLIELGYEKDYRW